MLFGLGLFLEQAQGLRLRADKEKGDETMIGLTRLNGSPVVVNAELIETVESTPDTVVSLTSGKKFIVLQSPDEVIERVMHYRQKTAGAAQLTPAFGGRPAAQPLSQHED